MFNAPLKWFKNLQVCCLNRVVDTMFFFASYREFHVEYGYGGHLNHRIPSYELFMFLYRHQIIYKYLSVS